MEKPIKVPDGMLKAALRVVDYSDPVSGTYEKRIRAGLEAALLWWSEHPIMPTTEEDAKHLCAVYGSFASFGDLCAVIEEWQRRMFVAEEQITEPGGPIR